MAFARKIEGEWVEIFGGFTDAEGVQHPLGWCDSASPEQLAAVGAAEIEEPGPAPSEVQVIGMALSGTTSPVRVWTTVPFDLADLRSTQIARVNEGAGAFRRRFITDVSGQQATYLDKEVEAKAWALGADAADFPYLAAEADASGVPIADIAALVLATAATWRALNAKIEGRRRGAIVAIEDEGATAEAIIAAAAIDWDALLV